MEPKVVRVDVRRDEIDYGHPEVAEALRAVTGGRLARLPLAPARLELELTGVPTAVVNAIRRTLLDEMPGRRLTFDNDGFEVTETTDPFMSDRDFVRGRIQGIRLTPQIPENAVRDLKFALDVKNETASPITIYSGDLLQTNGTVPFPLFNPTYEIAFLQQGRTLQIRDIRIEEGTGRQNALFSPVVRAAARPLDVPEVDTRRGEDKSHTENLEILDSSGFTQSSLEADPRHHLLTAWVPAVPAKAAVTVALLLDACSTIVNRLRYVLRVLSEKEEQHGANSYYLQTPVTAGTQGQLVVGEETDTIGNLLKKCIYIDTPEIAFVNYQCIPHEKVMRLTVVHDVADPDDVRKIIVAAAKEAIRVFEAIQQQIQKGGMSG